MACFFADPVWSGDHIHTIEIVKPSVVGIGSFQKTRRPTVVFMGAGFAVSDGLNVITNAHVVHGIIGNSVFAKGTKETAISHPSGITYAIPIKYMRELL